MTDFNIEGISPNSSDLAKFWIEQGFSIFPVGRDKKPQQGYKWGDFPITSLEEAELRWNGANRGAGVGIITGKNSNLLVLDVDNKNGVHGDASLSDLEKKYGALPATLVVKTPNNGRQFYFRYSDCGLTVGAGVVEGIDYRGQSGYVVAAGTYIKDGYYTILNNHAIAEAPTWIIDVIKNSSQAVPVKQDEEQSSNFLATGTRNSSFTSIAGTMRRKGMGQEEIEEYLLAINAALSDPLPASEISVIAKSVAKYDPSDISVYTNEQDFADRLATEWEGKVRYVPALGFILNDRDVWLRDHESLKVKRLIQNAASKAQDELEKIASAQKDKKKAAPIFQYLDT